MKVEVTYDHRFLRFSRKETIRTVYRVLRREGTRMKSVSVVYTNNRRIHAINRKHLNHDFVTDVIAFELEPAPAREAEIYVNLDRARKQASEYHDTFSGEARRLVVHGMLHIAGYADGTVRAKDRMKRREDALLEDLRREQS